MSIYFNDLGCFFSIGNNVVFGLHFNDVQSHSSAPALQRLCCRILDLRLWTGDIHEAAKRQPLSRLAVELAVEATNSAVFLLFFHSLKLVQDKSQNLLTHSEYQDLRSLRSIVRKKHQKLGKLHTESAVFQLIWDLHAAFS